MTTIKASCPTCGEVELTPADVTLMVCTHAALSYYAFDCPTCARRGAQARRRPRRVAAGQRRHPRPGLGAARPRRSRSRTGPASTYDDLLDFALHLGTTDLLSAAAAATVAS